MWHGSKGLRANVGLELAPPTLELSVTSSISKGLGDSLKQIDSVRFKDLTVHGL